MRNKLSARGVASLQLPGRHSDGGGLYLSISADGRRRWVFMFTHGGRQREMGLGAARDVSLGKARELADGARTELAAGRDPLRQRVVEAEVPTFGAFAEELIGSLEGGFRNEKHKAQWRMTLSVVRDPETGEFLDTGYCVKLRSKLLPDITTDDVLAVLQPIWTTKSETASRVRGRVERVLDAAKAKGLRAGENPARWRGHLDALLSKRQKLQRGHHAAMPYADVPGFVARLQTSASMAALALEWTILATARTGETIGARLPEVDRKAKVWTVPPERMKAGREHRIPLTDRMLEILAVADEVRGDSDYIFPGPGRRRPLSGMAMSMLLRRMKLDDITVHGFRSAFRDWVSEETEFPREIAEAALAHVFGDETERAYRRGDALKKRAGLMQAWGNFVSKTPANA